MALPLMSVGDVLQVTLKGRLFGQRTNNTFYYNVRSTDGAQTFLEFASQWSVDFETLWTNFVSEDWTGDLIVIKRLTPTKTRGIELSIDWVGAVAQPALPPSTCAVISRWNYGNGPSNRGRIFIAGVPSTFHLAGELTNPAMAILTLLAAQMDDPCIDGADFTLDPGLFHRDLNVWEIIDGTTPRSILRQQRRREIGVGE